MYQRVSSTKTRIKTRKLRVQSKNVLVIKEYHPLKQGLRLIPQPHATFVDGNQRVSSTKTRIKTTR